MSFYPMFPDGTGGRDRGRTRRRYPDTWRHQWLRPENIV